MVVCTIKTMEVVVSNSAQKVTKILFIGPLVGRPADPHKATQKAVLCAEVAHDVCATLESRLGIKVISKIVTDYPVNVLYAGHKPAHVIDSTFEGSHPNRTALKRLTDVLTPRLAKMARCNTDLPLIVDFSGQQRDTLESLGFIIKKMLASNQAPHFVRVGSALPEADCPLPIDWIERRQKVIAQRAYRKDVPCPIASVVSERIIAVSKLAA